MTILRITLTALLAALLAACAPAATTEEAPPIPGDGRPQFLFFFTAG